MHILALVHLQCAIGVHASAGPARHNTTGMAA